jgi:hypothetical protein
MNDFSNSNDFRVSHEQALHRQPVTFEKNHSDFVHQIGMVANWRITLLVERETYLNGHLPVSNLAFLHLSASLEELEPAKVSQAL